MKKILLLTLCLCVAAPSFAQIQKGDLQLGGSLNIVKTEEANTESSSFVLSPNAGIFLSDLTSVGITATFNRQKGVIGGNENIGKRYAIGAYARFHKEMAEGFYLYLQPSLSFGFSKTDVFDAGSGNFIEADRNTLSAVLRPGVAYFLSPKFALDLGLGALSYARGRVKGGNVDETSTNYGLNLNLNQVFFGVNFYLRK